jgi:glucosamine--fructose-6-phosphate aminotransferase (isomerizing)
MGSSFFNSIIASNYLSSKGFSVDVRDTGEFLDFSRFNANNFINELIIGVSQSGESGELVKLVQKLRDEGFNFNNFWGITNTAESTLGKAARLRLLTKGGIETSVTSKTYTTGLLVHFLLARALCDEDPISPEIKTQIINLIETLQGKIESGAREFWGLAKKIDAHLGDYSFINFIGHGTSMATVLQSALNIKELAKIYAEGITVGMFRHGPIEIIDPKFRGIILINDLTSAKVFKPIIQNILEKWGKGKIMVITNHPEELRGISSDNLMLVENPIQNPYLAPIYDMILLQPYLCLKTEQHGFIPGEFRNTQKITK